MIKDKFNSFKMLDLESEVGSVKQMIESLMMNVFNIKDEIMQGL